MRRPLHPSDPRTTDLVCAGLSLALLAALLVATYGVLVPFFVALAATPLALAVLGAVAGSRPGRGKTAHTT